MIAGANSKGHSLSLNGQTVGGVYIDRAPRLDQRRSDLGRRHEGVQGILPDVRLHRARPHRVAGPDASRPVGRAAWAPRGGRAAAQGRLQPGGRLLRSTAATPGHRRLPSPVAAAPRPQRPTGDDLRLRRPAPTSHPSRRAAVEAETVAAVAATATAAAAATRRRPQQPRNGRGGGEGNGDGGRQRRTRRRATPLSRRGQPSWRRTSAATAPPSARPLTCGCTRPSPCPWRACRRRPRRAARSLEATSSAISASSSGGGEVVAR